MCGITGIWNLDGKPVDQAELDRFTDSLAHRGPDGRGTYVDPSGCLALGHRRLAILDLSSAAAQPMQDANERYVITYNGEIYNFLELRIELEGLGHRFKTSSDTEVLLAAYVQWGPECQMRLNGMWAFTVWDSHEHSMFISRDRFGIKPLYYFHDGNQFAFASEMKAFLHLEAFDASIDEHVMAAVIQDSNAVEAGTLCLLKNLNRLPAGSCLTVCPNAEPTVRKWWLTVEHLQEVPSSFHEQVEAFRELFFDSCRLRMRSDVPVGTSLSGGLDSSSVLCALSAIASGSASTERCASDWQRAFIATYPGTVQDEFRYADMVTIHTGASPRQVIVNEDELIRHVQKIVYDCENVQDVHVGPWLIYRQQRSDGVVVSLDGHGGDELLAGYVACEQPASGFLSDSAINLAATVLGYLPTTMLRRMLASACSAGSHGDSIAWLNASAASRAQLDTREYDAIRDRDDLFRKLYMELHVDKLPAILRNFDRCSMAHGVEVRTPFLDWRLVCQCFAMPSATKMHDGQTKRILRDAMNGFLPDPVRNRSSKLGFSNPLHDWLLRGLKPLVMDTLCSKGFLENSIWQGTVIRDQVERAYRTGNNPECIERAWRFVQAFMLMQRFKRQ